MVDGALLNGEIEMRKPAETEKAAKVPPQKGKK
jgi:hypothetical protein